MRTRACQLNINRMEKAPNSKQFRRSYLLIDLIAYPLDQFFIRFIRRGDLDADQFALGEMTDNNSHNHPSKSGKQ